MARKLLSVATLVAALILGCQAPMEAGHPQPTPTPTEARADPTSTAKPTSQPTQVLPQETPSSAPHKSQAPKFSAAEFMEECPATPGRLHACQDAYGVETAGAVVSGQIIKSVGGMVFLASPETLLLLDVLDALPANQRVEAIRRPEIRKALQAADGGQTVCDPSWRSLPSVRFDTSQGIRDVVPGPTPPRKADESGFSRLTKGDRITVDGFYLTSLGRSSVPILSGCRFVDN